MLETNINKTIENNYLKSIFKVITIIITLTAIIFIVYALKLGLFQDKNILINYIKHKGFLAPFIFVLIQILQVIIPVIPGGISCLVGVLIFGPLLGFIYNYIGLIIGSIIAFYLSKKYGLNIIKKIFKEETINKYITYIDNNNLNKLFFFSILIPGLPDDLLCYIAGISKMNLKTFITIILIGKPISLLMYSLFMNLL